MALVDIGSAIPALSRAAGLTRTGKAGGGGGLGASVVITGDKKADRALARLEKNVQRKTVRDALRNSAYRIVLPEAKASVPHDTGQLERSLSVRAAKRSRKGQGIEVRTRDGLFRGKTFYGGMVEMGTKFQEANPYLRPSLYGNAKRIRFEFISQLEELISGAAAYLGNARARR